MSENKLDRDMRNIVLSYISDPQERDGIRTSTVFHPSVAIPIKHTPQMLSLFTTPNSTGKPTCPIGLYTQHQSREPRCEVDVGKSSELNKLIASIENVPRDVMRLLERNVNRNKDNEFEGFDIKLQTPERTSKPYRKKTLSMLLNNVRSVGQWCDVDDSVAKKEPLCTLHDNVVRQLVDHTSLRFTHNDVFNELISRSASTRSLINTTHVRDHQLSSVLISSPTEYDYLMALETEHYGDKALSLSTNLVSLVNMLSTSGESRGHTESIFGADVNRLPDSYVITDRINSIYDRGTLNSYSVNIAEPYTPLHLRERRVVNLDTVKKIIDEDADAFGGMKEHLIRNLQKTCETMSNQMNYTKLFKTTERLNAYNIFSDYRSADLDRLQSVCAMVERSCTTSDSKKRKCTG
jgi:hypothetical protein